MTTGMIIFVIGAIVMLGGTMFAAYLDVKGSGSVMSAMIAALLLGFCLMIGGIFHNNNYKKDTYQWEYIVGDKVYVSTWKAEGNGGFGSPSHYKIQDVETGKTITLMPGTYTEERIFKKK